MKFGQIKGNIARAMTTDLFKTRGTKKVFFTVDSDVILFLREGKKRKTKYGKGGTFPSAGTQANERALLTNWDAKKKKSLREL